MLPINTIITIGGSINSIYNTVSRIWAGWRSATLTTTSLGSKLNALEYLLSTGAMLSPLNMGPQHLELLTSVLAIEGQLPRLSLKPGQQHIKTPLCPHQLHSPSKCTWHMYKKRDTGGFPKLVNTEMRAVQQKFRSNDCLDIMWFTSRIQDPES